MEIKELKELKTEHDLGDRLSWSEQGSLIAELEQAMADIDDIGSKRRAEALDEIADADAMGVFNIFEDWLIQSRITIQHSLDKEYVAGQASREEEMDNLLERAEKAEDEIERRKEEIKELKAQFGKER